MGARRVVDITVHCATTVSPDQSHRAAPAVGENGRRMSFSAHSLSPAEHKALLDAERRAEPFLVYRDGIGDLRFAPLGDRDRLVVGRVAGNDLVLDWDGQVSRSHAQLERVGTDWTLADDGLSRNGSQVNGERVVGRRRLADGDVIRVGQTTIVFRTPGAGYDSTIAEVS